MLQELLCYLCLLPYHYHYHYRHLYYRNFLLWETSSFLFLICYDCDLISFQSMNDPFYYDDHYHRRRNYYQIDYVVDYAVAYRLLLF